ncbi:MAG TPA: hypothetical protein ENL10_02845, partial [Candidatus Cloacimonetes bacterium]|nr:hypothetical protein [Candidatus Cloacimonadota bacterium]
METYATNKNKTMRKLISILAGILLSCSINAQDGPYYWYKGNRKYLEYFSNKEFVLIQNLESKQAIEEFFIKQGLNQIQVEDISEKTFHNTLATSQSITQKWAIISKTNSQMLKVDSLENILYSAPFLRSRRGNLIGLSNIFYVKLKNPDDFSTLEKFAREQSVTILRQNRFLPLWYTLSCSKQSKGISLDMANYFYESGLFAASQPNFLIGDILHCVDDEYWDDQWGLENTGQYNGTSGIDINVCDAWDVTFGDTCITVAVLDQGIEPSHPDLNSLSELSYDTESDPSPSGLYGDHGMAVTGIIGASTNNNDGIAGISPNVLIMTISNDFIGTSNVEEEELADGISWAADNGADVIHNSWGNDELENELIDDAIEDALTDGRGGLGCVVVFSAGNDNSSVHYPANSNPDVIAVGAMSPCGERKSPTSCDTENTWGSNYGNELDIVAPGVLVPTIDRQGTVGYNQNTPIHPNVGGTLLSSDYNDDDYTIWFNGTSAAAPHVSAVAALILSINSGLTQEEVCEILFTTATKLDGYTFNTVTGRPSTWNIEVGYGLLDAHAALEEAMCERTIENTTYTSDITISGCSSVEMEDVMVTDGAFLTIEDV